MEKSASGDSVMPVRYWKICGHGLRAGTAMFSGKGITQSHCLCVSHRVELSRFLEDGAVPLDNMCVNGPSKTWSWAENRGCSPFADGRRTRRANNELAGNRESNGLEPHAWLTDVLMRLPEWRRSDWQSCCLLRDLPSPGECTCRQVFVHRAITCSRELNSYDRK